MSKKKSDKKGPATPTVTVKFVGRYLVLTPKDPTTNSEVRLFAPRLNDPTVRLLSHLVSLTIDAGFVASGNETATRAIAVPGQDIMRELLIWDLGGFDVEFMGFIESPLTVDLPAKKGPQINGVIPDLGTVSTGRFKVDPELLEYNLPLTKPVASRINLVGGSLSCGFEAFGSSVNTGPDDYVFGPANDHSSTAGNDDAFPLADVITWQVASDSQFAIRLRAFDGGGARTIRCTGGDIQFTISNTCAAGLQINRDHEFAAFYDLSDHPLPWTDRQVPVLVVQADKHGKRHCDGTDHCSGSAQIAI